VTLGLRPYVCICSPKTRYTSSQTDLFGMAMALAVSAASFARRAAAFSAVQHALRQVQQTRNFGAAAAGAGGRLGFTFSQAHCGTLPGAVQHLVNLTRQLSGSPPFQAGAAAIPGAVPGTGGGSAEQSTGVAIPPAAGSAETDTGVSSSPGTSGAETSTGLGQPGQTSPAEVGTGLGDPAETPSAEVHLGGRSPGEGASAEQTADPTRDDQTPSGSEKDLSGLPGWTRESPEAAVAGSADNVPSSGTGDTHGSSSSSGSPKRQPLGSDEEWPKRIVRADKPGLLPAEVRNFIIQTRMRFWSRGIQEVVEQQFDPDEFLESAKDAYWMVTKLFNEREYDILKDMVSERLLKAFRETHEEFAAQGTEFSLVDQDVTDAYIVDIGYWDVSFAVEPFRATVLCAHVPHCTVLSVNQHDGGAW